MSALCPLSPRQRRSNRALRRSRRRQAPLSSPPPQPASTATMARLTHRIRPSSRTICHPPGPNGSPPRCHAADPLRTFTTTGGSKADEAAGPNGSVAFLDSVRLRHVVCAAVLGDHPARVPPGTGRPAACGAGRRASCFRVSSSRSSSRARPTIREASSTRSGACSGRKTGCCSSIVTTTWTSAQGPPRARAARCCSSRSRTACRSRRRSPAPMRSRARTRSGPDSAAARSRSPATSCRRSRRSGTGRRSSSA